MGLIMDTFKGLKDIKQAVPLQKAIDEEIEQLEKEGKLPDDLKAAYEAGKEHRDFDNVTDSLEPMKEFIAELEKYENLFPENFKNIIAKYESVEQDLEGVATDMDKHKLLFNM